MRRLFLGHYMACVRKCVLMVLHFTCTSLRQCVYVHSFFGKYSFVVARFGSSCVLGVRFLRYLFFGSLFQTSKDFNC